MDTLHCLVCVCWNNVPCGMFGEESCTQARGPVSDRNVADPQCRCKAKQHVTQDEDSEPPQEVQALEDDRERKRSYMDDVPIQRKRIRKESCPPIRDDSGTTENIYCIW